MGTGSLPLLPLKLVADTSIALQGVTRRGGQSSDDDEASRRRRLVIETPLLVLHDSMLLLPSSASHLQHLRHLQIGGVPVCRRQCLTKN